MSNVFDAARRGLGNYVSQNMKPFLEASARHFDASKQTWTASKLAGTAQKDDA